MTDLTIASGEMHETGVHFSDAYVLRYLLQQTASAQSPLVWLADDDDGSFKAASGQMRLQMTVLHSRSGSRAMLSLSDAADSIDIVEPGHVSFFGSRYATPEDAEVAQLLRALFSAIRSQATRNEQDREKRFEIRKQNIYRQLLFGSSERR